uniref:NADH dehydrogenase subunit 3 n=1 Tax=Ctenothrips transeolineae TaxID=3045420 RepID=UPI0030DFE0E6
MFMITAFISLCLSYILMMLTIFISKKSKNFKEKSTPFECGFDFFNNARMPFSMRFFLIAIIFIIFDVEIILILPLIPTIYKSNIFKWSFTSFTFLMIILLGILIEWKEKSFEWKK